MTLELRPISPRSASQAEYRAMTELWNRMRSEVLPDDPPLSLEERIASWKNIPDFVQVVAWAFWEGEEIVAAGNADYLELEENRHLLDFTETTPGSPCLQAWGGRGWRSKSAGCPTSRDDVNCPHGC